MTEKEIDAMEARLAAAEKQLAEDTEIIKERNQRIEESWGTLGMTQSAWAELNEENKKLRALVKEVEWHGTYELNQCPWCGAEENRGHEPDCARQLALKAVADCHKITTTEADEPTEKTS